MLATAIFVCSLSAVAIASHDLPMNPLAEKPDSGTLKRADEKDMRQVLKKLEQLGAKPIESRSVQEARAQPTPADAVKAVLADMGKSPLTPAVKMQDMTYPIEGGTQPLRIYTPEGAGAEPLPIIVYYHGGGWVIADLNTYEASALALATKAKAIVVSVEYRHSPEAKFPAAHEDAFAGYKWILDNAAKLGGNPKKVAVVGESAGGNLAINVAIMARDKKVQQPVAMVLVYPVTQTNMDTPSYLDNQNAAPLSKAGMGWFVDHVLAKPEDAKNPMLNLTTEADLKGLPSTTIIGAEIDPLRSDGTLLADKLEQAGVKVHYELYSGVTHEFFGMDAVVAKAGEAQDFAAADLRRAFGLK